MKATQTLLVSLLAGAAYAASVPHAVHEKRTSLPYGWQRRSEKPSARTIIFLSFALQQQNLELGAGYLMKVSDPDSTEYGKHWSAQKVVETFSPPNATIEAVNSWLIDSGISSQRIKVANGRNWVHVNVTLPEAEHLLRTEYKMYGSRGKRALACDEYSLPISVRNHIEFVKPTLQLAELARRSSQGPELSSRLDLKSASAVNLTAGPPLSSWDLTYCSNYTTPACLQVLYNMPNGTLNLSSFGVLEFAPIDTYRAQDLQLFLQTLNPRIPDTTTPVIEFIDQTSYVNRTPYELETNLDLSLAIALTYPQQITLLSSPLVGFGPWQDASDYVLEAIDASYCDVAAINTSIHGTCGGSSLPSVLSVSWGGWEDPASAAHLQRECNEWLKLSLQGHTVLYSSGDYGVSRPGNVCCANSGCATVNGTGYTVVNGTTFSPTWPSTCPWLTSVGGTRIAEGGSVKDREVVANQKYEQLNSAGVLTSTSWSSSGGFSNVFPRPEYQNDALRYYYDYHAPNLTAAQYNNSQHVRGYPDISANGVNTVIYNQGAPYLTGGTSASAPTVASLITLINQERIKAGKSVVGFINPVLYKNPHVFNDILEGNNPGCGTNGFEAVPGWDPVTGLGTPDYPKLLKVFMNLP